MENGKALLLEIERELSETKIKLISATGSEQLALLVSKQLLESRAEILSNGGLATIEFFFDSNGEKVTRFSLVRRQVQQKSQGLSFSLMAENRFIPKLRLKPVLEG
jgi:hypothetical protein